MNWAIIFLLCLSANRHIWRIVRLSCKFQKFSNFANSDFSVFLHESVHFVTFGTILRICKICQARIFSYFSANWYIWQFLGLLRKFRKFSNSANLNFFVFLNELAHLATFQAALKFSEICNNFQVYFSEKFFYFDFDEICAKITLYISFIRFCSFGRSKLLQTWIFGHIQQRLRPFFNFENFEIF